MTRGNEQLLVNRKTRTNMPDAHAVANPFWMVSHTLLLLQQPTCAPTWNHRVLKMASNWRVLLPKTKFPLRADPTKHEPAIQKARNFQDLYQWQLDNRPHDKSFTLHDGPPFANGDPHMGHVLNKVLKDIINRYKIMKGYRIHYRPGWDCHGLPIEMKACQNLPPNSSVLETRETAKSFAKKAIAFQKKSFIRWGVLGDWNNPYITMSKQYESNQIDVFYRMYKQGCIYRGYKPVYWSPSTLTALAEAELEYREHNSRAVYVLCNCTIPQLSSYGNTFYSLVWTTTPWTLPLNKAICYNPDSMYTLVKQSVSGNMIIIGAKRLEALNSVIGNYEFITEFPGSVLNGSKYTDIFNDSTVLPFLPADHVRSSEGTGLVHTAPAHGFDDYGIGLKYNLDVTTLVDANGRFMEGIGDDLAGMEVLGSGNEAVISKLKSKNIIIHDSNYTHRYPYDWRSKEPVIIRSTKQWFASVKSLKDKAVEAFNGVRVLPSSSTKTMKEMLEGRDEWCISRQRVWGVPIPVFFSLKEGEPYLMNDESINHIKELFVNNGADCWWSLPMEQLLPPSMKQLADEYSKGQDTMDVWFDSGSSWASVCPNGVADVYLEGKDQHRGWFQSSLLTSVATQGKSPYKELICHGFVLDKDGDKMSKSLGNVMTPNDIINNKKYGADTMRLWVMSSNFTSDISIGNDILEQTNELLQKIRLTFRFLLGNLTNFDSSIDILPYTSLPPLDRYQLHKLYEYYSIASHTYETHSYSKLHNALKLFIRHDISAFYFNIIKDRLYCDSVNSINRRSSLTVLHYYLVYLLTSLGPILPHLVEEVSMYYPLEQGICGCGHSGVCVYASVVIYMCIKHCICGCGRVYIYMGVVMYM